MKTATQLRVGGLYMTRAGIAVKCFDIDQWGGYCEVVGLVGDTVHLPSCIPLHGPWEFGEGSSFQYDGFLFAGREEQYPEFGGHIVREILP